MTCKHSKEPETDIQKVYSFVVRHNSLLYAMISIVIVHGMLMDHHVILTSEVKQIRRDVEDDVRTASK